MKILFYVFILVSCSCSTDKSPIIAPISDDYIIKFTFIRGQDIYEKGQNIGKEFYIYQNGTIHSFNKICKEDNKYLESWTLGSAQIDSLHSLFERTGFNEFPDIFPGPPIIGPSSSTSISYRKDKGCVFKKIYSKLSQEESHYPDGFFEIYNYLRSICFVNL